MNIVFFVGADDSHEVVSFHAGGIQLELLLDDLSRLLEKTLLNQSLGFLKRRRDSGRWAGLVAAEGGMLGSLPKAGNRKRGQEKNAEQSRMTIGFLGL